MTMTMTKTKTKSLTSVSSQANRFLGFIVAVVGAPIVGAIAAAVVMSWLMPGEAAMLGVMYALFGAGISITATVLVGVPAYCFLSHRGYPLGPWLLAVAFVVGQVLALVVPCLAAHCDLTLTHNSVFALVASLVTALLVVRIAQEVR